MYVAYVCVSQHNTVISVSINNYYCLSLHASILVVRRISYYETTYTNTAVTMWIHLPQTLIPQELGHWVKG